MDELNSLMGQSEQVNIEEMFAPQSYPVRMPEMSVKTLSATASLLNEDSEQLSSYGSLISSGMQGDFASHKRILDNSTLKQEKYDQATVIGILGDNSIPFEQKEAAIKGISKSPLLKSPEVALVHKASVQDNPGESFEQEQVRVLGLGEQIAKVYSDIQKVQGLKNAFVSSREDRSDLAVGIEAAESLIVPFAYNLIGGEISRDLASKQGKKRSLWDTFKSYALAGENVKDLRKGLEAVPLDQREALTADILETLERKNSITFSGYNQFVQVEKARQIFDADGYSDTDKWIDNLTPLLDIVGMGAVLRGGKTAKTVAKGVTSGVTATPPAVLKAAEAERASRAGITTADLAKAPTPTKVPRGNLDEINNLINQRAALLGSANELDPGMVRDLKQELASLKKPDAAEIKVRAKEIQASQRISYKEAKAKADAAYADLAADYEASKARLERQLELNAGGNKVNQEISVLDKRIAELEATAKELVTPKKNPIADMLDRIEFNSVIRNVNPAAPGNLMGMANPSIARKYHAALIKSEVDEGANALFGASRIEVLADNVMPQVITETGTVAAKTFDIERGLRGFVAPEDSSIAEFLANTGTTGMTRSEKAQAQAKIVNSFQNASGLTVNDAMGGLKFDDKGNALQVTAVYGTSEGGWLYAEQALRQAQFALKTSGVKASDIEILKRTGIDYEPVELSQVVGKEGDYLVRVNMEHTYDVKDIEAFKKLDVVKNWFDRVPGTVKQGFGSVTRHLFDVSSVLNKAITASASNASDFSARLERLLLDSASSFSDQFMKLPSERREVLGKYFLEANFEQIKFDIADLTARGFDGTEIEIVKSWRKHWDNVYYLENLDMVRSLNNQGYGLLKAGTTELFAKEIQKNSTVRFMFNPATDKVVELTKTELDALYDAGGFQAKLRRPIEIDGQVVEHVIVRNTPNEYIRKVRDSDKVLNYREGYFQLQYTAPKFVDEYSKTGRKAIAVAGDTAEAESFKVRMQQQNPDKEYRVRDDKNALQVGSDDWFDVNAASGRIAQRHRGKLLEASDGLNHLGDQSYILNPADSAIRASRSIAGRTMSRQMLETAKARALAQYGELASSNGYGGKRWPQSIDEINANAKSLGVLTEKQTADFRTTWEYINYLENGYINGIDTFVKGMFNALGNVAGKSGMTKLERSLYGAGDVNVASAAKSGVFWAYIASNPLRQWIVQPHQIIRMLGYNPVGMISQIPIRQAANYALVKSGLGNEADKAFVKFVDDSGLMDAVDKHNLIRGSLLDMADNSSKLKRIARDVYEAPRKIGFDSAERTNMLFHSAVVYDKYKRMGKNLADATVRNEAYSEIRALTYDMNFAGDMPYNQNALGVVMQFMQVPHKAVSQLTNRRLPASTRAKLFITDLAIFGVPLYAISEAVGGDIAPENKELRDLLAEGAESFVVNKVLEELFKEDVDIDLSGLAPYNMEGFGKMFLEMIGSPTQAMLNSPSGQLFLKDGGRAREAIGAMSRYFGVSDDSDLMPETLLSVLYKTAQISSGFSNFDKARLLLDAEKSINARGDVIDDKVGHVDALAQLFGFTTNDARKYYEYAMSESKSEKEYKEEVVKSFNTIVRYYRQELQSPNSDPRFIQAVSSAILKKYEGKPLAQQIIHDELKRLTKDDKGELLKLILRRTGYPAESSMTRDKILNMPYDEETIRMTLDRWESIQKLNATQE